MAETDKRVTIVFRALADDTRRRILRLLRRGPLSSGNIADRFDSSWPTISRHLAILRDAGLVRAERIGQEIRYELNTSVFEDLTQHLMQWVEPDQRSAKLGPRRQRTQEV
jgi:ArsR family transcriptional regulator, repressor of sdpIR and other operons